MKKTSVNELMGSGGERTKSKRLGLSDLSELLGEKMPKIDYTPVGRFRLQTALRNRFGEGYKNLPGIEDILKEFDGEASFNVKLTEMKMIKAKGK